MPKHSTQLITALDVDQLREARAIIDGCLSCDWFKVGAQLFTRRGPRAVAYVRDLGRRVFLDLKFHDIPNTVAKAAAGAAEMGVDLMTCHALGGKDMIAAARESIEDYDCQLLAVTILTSHTDENLASELGLKEKSKDAVPRLAKLAVDAGAHGIVCSPRETKLVREAVGRKPTIVTPGVRPSWSESNDQKRVATPREAAEAGANFVVVGRPVTQADDPGEAARMIQKELRL